MPSSQTEREVDALRAWRRENGLPEIADPPLHWSDAEYARLSHSRGRAVAVAEHAVRYFAELTQEILRAVRP
jgi:hypothetical protein